MDTSASVSIKEIHAKHFSWQFGPAATPLCLETL
jgi:hypothetical protein